MPTLRAVAPSPNVRSNAASPAALAPKTPTLVTALTTASHTPWRGRRARASLPPRRLWLPSNRLMPDVNFERRWTPIGKRVKNGPMVNWRMWQPPRRGRLKKGAPSEPPKRYPPGNRNALRPSSRPGSGFRRLRDGGTAAGSAVGGVRPATAAECRHQRSCRSRNFPQMRDVHLPQSRAHALPKVSRRGPMHIHRRCRGWLQGSHRNSPQTGWHARVRRWRKRHHRPALLQTQWTL
jgi:hypothetical protein